MNKIKIIFFGSNKLSVACLNFLINSKDFEVVAVVCQPDKPFGRGKKMSFSFLKEIAIKNNILCLQPYKVIESFDELKKLQSDLGVCVAYGQFLPEKILNLFDKGVINIHPSLLPKYRGAAPIQHAIWSGETSSAITIMKMTKGMDAGPYCYQKEFKISDKDNFGTIMNLVINEAPKILYENLKLIFENNVTWIQQDDSKKTLAPILTREQEKINWFESSNKIFNHIRAFSPVPGTYSFYDKNKNFIKFFDAYMGNHKISSPPGTINEICSNYICVNSGQNDCVHIIDFLIPGKKRTNIKEYHGRFPFNSGDSFY